MDIPHHLFTTNRDQGWIEVIRKGEKYERLASKTEHCISITCTGWANIQGYITRDERDYVRLTTEKEQNHTEKMLNFMFFLISMFCFNEALAVQSAQ